MQSVPKEIQCDLQVTGGNQQKGMCREAHGPGRRVQCGLVRAKLVNSILTGPEHTTQGSLWLQGPA